MTLLLLVVLVWVAFNLGGNEAKENLRALHAAIVQRGKHSDDYCWYLFEDRQLPYEYEVLRFLEGHFYTAKAIICVLLGRLDWRLDGYGEKAWMVAAYDGEDHQNPEWGTYHSWTELLVGRGILKGWAYNTGKETSA